MTPGAPASLSAEKEHQEAAWLDLEEYKRSRTTLRLWTPSRKVLGIAARLTLGWRIRVRLLRWMGVDIGHCYVGHDCLFDDEVPELISVADGWTVPKLVIKSTTAEPRPLLSFGSSGVTMAVISYGTLAPGSTVTCVFVLAASGTTLNVTSVA